MAPRVANLLILMAALLPLLGCNSVVCFGGAIPSVASLSPSSVPAGSAQFTLIVTGSQFNSSARVEWNGQPQSTIFVSATELQAIIPAGEVAAPGTAEIGVTVTSNSKCSLGQSNLIAIQIN